MKHFDPQATRWICDPYMDYGFAVGVAAEQVAKGRWYRQGAFLRQPDAVTSERLAEASDRLQRELRLSIDHPLYHRVLLAKRRLTARLRRAYA